MEEDSEYFIMLTAVNSDGKSEPVTVETNTSAAGIQMFTSSRILIVIMELLNTIQCKIYFVAPTGPPLRLQNTIYNSTSITIQWEDVECSQRNGVINNYNVTHYCNSGENGALYSKTVSNQMFTATRLKFNTSYIFEVQALSKISESGPPAYISVNTSSFQGR